MIGRALRAQMGARRRSGASGGVAPTITVAPVLTWTVAHGSSPTITEGTYTGDAGTWTYDLVRLPSTTVLSGVSKATVEAYVADRATDVGPDWKVTGTITNGSGSDSADSNTVTWDRSTLPIAGGHSGEGLTLADSGTTVDAWSSSFGSVSATLTAPTAGQRPAYSATGGTGGRPIVTGDGVTDVLTGTVTKGSAFATVEFGAVMRSVGGTTTGRPLALNNTASFLGENAGSMRFLWTATSQGTSTNATIAHWSGDGVAAGDINIRHNGTIEDTDPGAGSSISDGATLAVFARVSGGGNAANVAMQGWYLGPQLTTDQRLDLRALLTYLTGVSS